jgi:RNA recognition motif-containing protein
MKPMIPWHTPLPLPERPEITKAQVESQELLAENQRMKSIMQAHYILDENVPSNPIPLSAIEEQQESAAQSSSLVSDIPFFVPQTAPIAEPSTVPVTPYTDISQSFTSPATPFLSIPTLPQYDNVATAEFLQSLGLPMFLIGQSKSAVQTLATSPGLLSTLVDSQGLYDQPRLLNLVQTLSASTGGVQSQTQTLPLIPAPYQPPMPTYSAPVPPQSFMHENTTSYPSIGVKSKSYPSSGGTRLVVDKSVEGNLHISGFGIGTTDADIIATFSPYVRIDEIVMKGTYAFVNSSDPPSAARARDALQGTLIRGAPITIKQATRKQKDPNASAGPYGPSQSSLHSNFGQVYGNQLPPVSLPPTSHQGAPIPPGANSIPPYGIMDVDSVRDDRGNPATKNLFIAGYGPSTTEQQLRDLVSQHVIVVGVILKGTFSFVNTVDRESAVHARNMLSGAMLNSGVVRINFAKETGRLGTSFDLTYGPNTGPNALNTLRNPMAPAPIPRPQEAAMSYYGRGY